MPRSKAINVDAEPLELAGVHYVVVRASVFRALCRRAGITVPETTASTQDVADRATLAEKLISRRKAAGLSQADLARRAGIRAETLNRIERGRTEPDFATMRKLLTAMTALEQEQANQSLKQRKPRI